MVPVERGRRDATLSAGLPASGGSFGTLGVHALRCVWTRAGRDQRVTRLELARARHTHITVKCGGHGGGNRRPEAASRTQIATPGSTYPAPCTGGRSTPTTSAWCCSTSASSRSAWLLAYAAGFEAHIPTRRAAPRLAAARATGRHPARRQRAAGLYGPVWRYASVEEGLRAIVAVAVGAWRRDDVAHRRVAGNRPRPAHVHHPSGGGAAGAPRLRWRAVPVAALRARAATARAMTSPSGP